MVRISQGRKLYAYGSLDGVAPNPNWLSTLYHSTWASVIRGRSQLGSPEFLFTFSPGLKNTGLYHGYGRGGGHILNTTVAFQISVHIRVFILRKNTGLYGLIWVYTLMKYMAVSPYTRCSKSILLREDINPPRFLLNRVPEQITETDVWNQIYYY